MPDATQQLVAEEIYQQSLIRLGLVEEIDQNTGKIILVRRVVHRFLFFRFMRAKILGTVERHFDEEPNEGKRCVVGSFRIVLFLFELMGLGMDLLDMVESTFPHVDVGMEISD